MSYVETPALYRRLKPCLRHADCVAAKCLNDFLVECSKNTVTESTKRWKALFRSARGQ
jgi:hypothetical protein